MSKVVKISLIMLYLALWFWVQESRATLSTNQLQNQNKSQFGRLRFPAKSENPLLLWRKPETKCWKTENP